MKIYRMQDNSGRGPWKPGFSHKWVRVEPDYDLVPWYEEWRGFDPLEEVSAGWVCGSGCLTVEQLRRWFLREEYERLLVFGYRSVVIEVDRVLRASERQVVFGRRRALRKGVRVFELY